MFLDLRYCHDVMFNVASAIWLILFIYRLYSIRRFNVIL